MDSNQFNQLLQAIENAKLEIQIDVRAMHVGLYQRISRLESRVHNEQRNKRPTGAPQLHTAGSRPSATLQSIPSLGDNGRGHGQGVSIARGESTKSDNVHLLPFALEDIKAKSLLQNVVDPNLCDVCNRVQGQPSCFRNNHFNWCAIHETILSVHATACFQGAHCSIVSWKEVPNWAEIVDNAFAIGDLGNKGVMDLQGVLFP